MWWRGCMKEASRHLPARSTGYFLLAPEMHFLFLWILGACCAMSCYSWCDSREEGGRRVLVRVTRRRALGVGPAHSAQGPLGAWWVCALHVTVAKDGPVGAQSTCVILSQDWGHWLGPSRAGMVTMVFCCPQQNQGCVYMGVNMSTCHHSMAVHCGLGHW